MTDENPQYYSRIAARKAIELFDEYFRQTSTSMPISLSELPAETGIKSKWKISYSNGVHALFKPGLQFKNIPYQKWPEKAVASYQIDRSLGVFVVPITVIANIDLGDGRGALRGSLMNWIENAQSPSKLKIQHEDRPDQLKFLDSVIGNCDRKIDDWLINMDGLVFGIDNDDTFKHDNAVLGSDKKAWEHELASIRDRETLSPYVDRLRTFQASLELNFILAELDLKDRDRFKDHVKKILDWFDV